MNFSWCQRSLFSSHWRGAAVRTEAPTSEGMHHPYYDWGWTLWTEMETRRLTDLWLRVCSHWWFLYSDDGALD